MSLMGTAPPHALAPDSDLDTGVNMIEARASCVCTGSAAVSEEAQLGGRPRHEDAADAPLFHPSIFRSLCRMGVSGHVAGSRVACAPLSY